MTSAKHLVFIDENLSDITFIVENLPEGSQWFTINGSRDGVSQIEQIAKNYENLDSIQIVSHGNSGALTIGSTALTNQNLSHYQTSLSEIGKSLSSDGDLLIYGCNLAANENGEKLINGIAEYTLADVAASTDLTGSSAMGGDSDLEFRTGEVLTSVINMSGLTENLVWSDSQIESALTNTTLEDKMKDYNSDNSYSYLEMRTLLETAAVGGITSTEFADLKTVYTNIESEFEKDPGSTDSYVQYITYSTIYPSAANAKWWGAATKLSDTETLGNMDANTSQDKATKLIKKWFYGEDLPMPVAGGDTANPAASAKIGQYKASTGVMFKADIDLASNTSSTMSGVVVTSDDMNQGNAGDCWILACMGAVAHVGTGDAAKAGKAIENLVIDPITNDQIFGMKFYNNNKEAVYVTVNSEIPVSTKNTLFNKDKVLFAGNGESYTVDDSDLDGISDGDNLSTAGNLTLDGSLTSGGVGSMSGGYGKLAITSTGNDSGVTFTVTGTNYWNTAKTETITGANAGTSGGNTWWKTISQISASGATDGNVISGKEKGNEYTLKKDLNGEMWPSLFEKGYTQANPLLANRSGGEVSYAAMEGGGPIGLKHLAGVNYTNYNGSSTYYDNYWGWNKATVQNLSEAIQAGAVAYVGGNKAGNLDGKRTIIKSHAHMLIDYDPSNDKFLVRNPWGGQDSSNYDVEFWLTLDQLSSEDNPNRIFMSDPITVKKSYGYTVTSNATSSGAAVFEGSDITFTITRNGVGDETTVYLSTVAGTADSNDYQSSVKTSLNFGAQETTKTFVVGTFNDALTEGSNGVDNFSLGLFLKATQGSPTVSSTAYIKDKAPTDYNYTITSSAATANAAVTEGEEITFTITRAKANSSDADSESTVYLNTANGTARTGEDYSGVSNQKIDFNIFQTSQKFVINTLTDIKDEGKENFDLKLYKDLTASNAGGSPTAQAAGYVNDAWTPSYSYTITSDAGTSSEAKTEGKTVTFTVTRSGSSTESKVYLSTINQSAITGDDFEGIEDQALVFKANQKTRTVEIKTKMDIWLENNEFFQLGLYTDTNTKEIVASGSAFLKNADFNADSYVITNDSISGGDPDGISTAQSLNDPDAISNGDNLSSSGNLTIDGASASGGTATLNGKAVTITSAGDDSTAKFTVTGTKSAKDLNGDGDTNDAGEGAGAQTEVIWGVNAGTTTGQKIFKTVTQIAVDKATAGNVTTGVSGGDLTINGAFNSGGTATLNGKFVSITTSGKDNSVPFLVTGTDSGDAAITDTIFGVSQGTATGTKSFKTVTKVTANAATAGNVSVGTIGDGTDEGKDITFTITRGNVNNAADSVFISTASGTAKESDFTPINGQEVKFTEFETTKTVKVSAISDSVVDDGEYFWLKMYLNQTDLNNNDSSVSNKAYIDHVPVPTQHTYAITNDSPSNNSATVSEGGAVTFTIARTLASGSASPSTIYVSTATGSANKDDFAPIDKMEVNFGKKELQKTITVNTKSDTVSESEEDFYLIAYKTFNDAENEVVDATWQYNKAYIKNVTPASYTYTVKTDAGYDNPVEEGSDILFTITRSATGSASTVYVGTTQGTADPDDYTVIDKIPVAFAAQQKTKTIKVTSVTDNLTESKEFLYLDLYKTIDDAEAGNFSAWDAGYIKDKAGTSASDYTYAISTKHNTKDANFSVSDAGNISADTIITVQKDSGSAATFTAKASGASGQQFNLNSSASTTATNIASAINAHSDFTASASGALVTVSVSGGGTTTLTTGDAARMTATNPVLEGEDATFTVTRTLASGKTASAATVYVSTRDGTAKAEDADYQFYLNLAVDFKKDELTKEVTIPTFADTTSDAGEYFFLELYKNEILDITTFQNQEQDVDAWGKAYLKNDDTEVSNASAYNYAISSSNDSGGDANFSVSDAGNISADTTITVQKDSGSAVTFTAKASGASGQQFNLNSSANTTATNMASAINAHSNFTASASGAVVTVSVTGGGTTTLATGDAARMTATNGAAKEGEQITFTITRSREDGNAIGSSDKPTTVYVSTSEATAYSEDYQGLTLSNVDFKKDETVKTVTIDTIVDTSSESAEYFWFDLYKTKLDADDFNYHSYAQGHIKDDTSLANSLGNYTYSVASSTSDGNGVKEGGDVTFTITRTKVDSGEADVKSTVFVSTSEGSAYEDDYVPLDLEEIKFKKTETKKVVTVKTKKDSITDDNESFWFDVFKTKAAADNYDFAAWGEGYIADDAGAVTAAATYEYTVTSSHNAANNKATEGSDVTFTITRTNSGGGADSASTIYISTTPGSASEDDFEVITNKAIEFKASESSKQITIGTKKDADADDGEYFWFDVYKSLSDAEDFEYYKWDKGFIADDVNAASSLNNYTYAVTSANNSGNKVTEGGLATFTITRSEIDASKANVAATVYVATSEGTASADDFESVTKHAIEFKKDETSKTFTVQTKEDGVSESGGEYFSLELYKTEGDLEDGEYTAYGKAFIADNASAALAVSNYNYTVTGSNDSTGTAVSEGSDMTFTITRAEIDASQTDVASTVYVSTTHSTTDAEDIESWDKKKVEFLKDELTKTITIKTNTDSDTEGYESFWLDIFKTKADADEGNFAAYDEGYLKDNSTAAAAANTYKYVITTTAGKLDPVTEGTDITFTITRTRVDGKAIQYGQDKASTVFVGTQDSSATSSDYEAMLVPTELKFLPLDQTKTITVKTYADEETEQNESFYLGLFKTKGAINTYAETGDESLVDAYTDGYMKDPAAVSGVGTFTYTVTTDSPSNSAKTEGSDITVTITRNVSGGNPGDSTIYMNTTAGSAGEDDYTAQKATPVVFTSSNGNGTTKNITIKTSTDALSESKESFYVDLFKTIADANEGWPYFTFDTAYIANGAAEASASRTYTIDNNSKTEGAARDEGTTVTFTITVDDTNAASKVWVSTVDGTAKAGEDYTAISKKEISFAQGDSSETVTVTLLNDTDTTDDNEAFYLELYKSKKDAEEGDEYSYSKALINNTSVTDDYYYKIVSSHQSSNPVTEGSDITFTVTRWTNTGKTIQGTTGDTTVYVSTSASYDSSDDDFQKITAQPFTFKDGEQSKTYTVSTTSDSIVEGKHKFWFDVYKDKADAELDNWGGTNGYTGGYITDASSGLSIPADTSSSSPNYTYIITNTNSILGNSGKVIEGADATFTITRSGSGTESTVYVSTFITNEAGYAGAEDFTPLDHVAVIFGKDEFVKEIRTATILDDNKTEANESFYLRMNKGATGESYEPGVYDEVVITQPSGMLGVQLLGGNSGAISGTDTITVTAAAKTSFPGHNVGQFFNDFAFSAKTSNGKVVSWGNAAKGGDSNAVSAHLTGVSKIYSNTSAFAAVKSDGSVVTWGNADAGGTSWDADGLSVSATLSGSGNLVLGGAATSSGSATFSKGNKITITSAGSDSARTFTVTGTDASGGGQTETITGANAGTAEGSKLFKTVTQIAVDGATAGNVTAGNLFSLTYDIASDLNGGTDVSKISSTADAFAAIRADGSVIAWGNKGTGGDSSSVSSSLNGTVNVRDIYSNMTSFAAVREDGSVITWGYGSYGGDSSSVVNKITTTGHSDFKTVTDISATGSAFAAIRSDGSVVTWGNTTDGGDSSGVASAIDGDTDPTDVVQVYATTSAFAALQKNGAVITWGDVNNGGSISSVSASLNGATDVIKIHSTNTAFAALRSDGSVISWGDSNNGGNSSSVASDLDGDSNGDGNASDTTQDITKIFSTISSFAALRADNKVVTWGYGAYGGDSSSVTSIINGTLDADSVSVSANVSAGGNFVLGGDQTSGGAASFANAERITITSAGDDSARTFTVTGTDASGGAQTETITGANAGAATSMKYFKTITQIGIDGGGATAGAVTAGIINKEVKTIVSTDKAFAALLNDGSVISWGDATAGGDSSSVTAKLIMGGSNSSAVTSLSSSSGAFSAIKADGSVVTWGNSDLGGDSSGVDFSTNSIQGMSGASSGSECTVNCAANTAKKIGTASFTLKDSGGSAVSGTFITGSDGKLDFSNVSNGTYTASYTLSDSNTDSIINATDVSAILDISTKLNGSPSNTQKISADMNGDGIINATDVSAVLDISTNLNNSGATGVLRDPSASNPFSTTSFAVSAGSDLTLSAYILGDFDGTYANIL